MCMRNICSFLNFMAHRMRESNFRRASGKSKLLEIETQELCISPRTRPSFNTSSSSDPDPRVNICSRPIITRVLDATERRHRQLHRSSIQLLPSYAKREERRWTGISPIDAQVSLKCFMESNLRIPLLANTCASEKEILSYFRPWP